MSLLAGDGFYSAVWVLCSDTVTDGKSTAYPQSDCANTSGQFSNSTTFEGVGGTSAAAPAFAGMLAMAIEANGGRLGQADTVLYQLAAAHPSYFHDVTSGDNSVPCVSGTPNCGSNEFMTGYNAGPGYDLATGLGSVDAAAIVNNWKSVSLGSTSTTLEINGSSASYTGVHGAKLTFAAAVAGSSGTPTGVVAITDNADMTAGGTAAGAQNNGQGAIPLASGSGSVNYNGLPGGSYQVTGRYGGDTTFGASSSTPISVTISPEASTTTLTVNAYNLVTGKTIPNPNIPYGSYVFLDAAITGAAEGSDTQGVATGTVQFLNGSAPVGSGAVSSGNQASWPPLNTSLTPMSGGTYNLTANYSGDASFLPSAGTASFTVVKAPTTITVGYAQTQIEYGNQEQIAADVLTNCTGIAPTGTFQFYVDGQAILAPQPVYESGGYNPNNTATPYAWADAQTTYAFLSLGQHMLSVTYSGDGNYAGGTSTNVTATVGQARTEINGYGFTNPQGDPVVVGQSRTGIATVFGSQYGVAPTGNVTFYDDNVALTDPVTYTASVAAPTLSATTQHVFTTAGTHQITVSYSGDSNYISSTTSTAQSLNVLGPFSVSASSLNSLTPGQSESSSLTITPNGGYTGSINLTCAVTTNLPNSIDLPTCSVPTTVTISGTSAATATLTVNTTAATSGAVQRPLYRLLAVSGNAALAFVFLFGISARRRDWRVLLSFVFLVFIAGLVGCGGSSAGTGGGGGGGGGGGNSGTTAGAYTVTVTGTDAATGKITASTTVTLAVN